MTIILIEDDFHEQADVLPVLIQIGATVIAFYTVGEFLHHLDMVDTAQLVVMEHYLPLLEPHPNNEKQHADLCRDHPMVRER